jgi:hypothetical protein
MFSNQEDFIIRHPMEINHLSERFILSCQNLINDELQFIIKIIIIFNQLLIKENMLINR